MSVKAKKVHFELAFANVDSALDHLITIDCQYMKSVSRNQRTSMYLCMDELCIIKERLEKILKSIRPIKEEPTTYVPMSEPVDGIDDLDEDIPF